MEAMFPLPTELVLEIVSHLPRPDIYKLSFCSKYLREVVLPFVFDHIKLRDKLSVKAFNDSGILSHTRNFVRHVTIRCYDVFDGKAMFNAYICASSLRLFPNLTGLDVRVRNNKLQYSLFLEIVKTAATGENYPNLSELSLIYESVTVVPTNFQMVYIVEMDPTRPSEKFKLRTHWGIPHDIKIPPPPSLRRVSIIVDEFAFGFEMDSERSLMLPRTMFPTLYIADKDIASNLEELEIRAEQMAFYDSIDTAIPIKYPRVKKLRLISKLINGILLDELVERFPNLEELDVERTDPVPLTEYAHITRFTQLRKLRAPLPSLVVPSLDEMINSWVRSGLNKLQQVEFILLGAAYLVMPSITYKVVEGEDGRIARVTYDNFWHARYSF